MPQTGGSLGQFHCPESDLQSRQVRGRQPPGRTEWTKLWVRCLLHPSWQHNKGNLGCLTSPLQLQAGTAGRAAVLDQNRHTEYWEHSSPGCDTLKLPPTPFTSKQCFTLKRKCAYSRGFSWCLCLTKERTLPTTKPHSLTLCQHSGNAEASALQGWRGEGHFQGQQRHGFAMRSWCFQLMKYRKGDVSHLARRPASPSLALQLWLWSLSIPVSIPGAQPQHRAQLKALPSPAGPGLLQQFGLSWSAVGTWSDLTSRQDVMLRGEWGPTWFQIHLLTTKPC